MMSSNRTEGMKNAAGRRETIETPFGQKTTRRQITTSRRSARHNKQLAREL